MSRGREVGLNQSNIVLDGDPAPAKKGGGAPHFSADVYCGQTAVRLTMPLGTEVGLCPGDVVLDGDPAPPYERGTAAPLFWSHVYCGRGRPSKLLLSPCSISFN